MKWNTLQDAGAPSAWPYQRPAAPTEHTESFARNAAAVRGLNLVHFQAKVTSSRRSMMLMSCLGY